MCDLLCAVSLLFLVMHAEPSYSSLALPPIFFFRFSMLARGNRGHGSFLNSTCFSRTGENGITMGVPLAKNKKK